MFVNNSCCQLAQASILEHKPLVSVADAHVDAPTCPAGGDAALAGLVLELSLGLAEGKLQGGLKQLRRTHRETSREVRHMGAPESREGPI